MMHTTEDQVVCVASRPARDDGNWHTVCIKPWRGVGRPLGKARKLPSIDFWWSAKEGVNTETKAYEQAVGAYGQWLMDKIIKHMQYNHGYAS